MPSAVENELNYFDYEMVVSRPAGKELGFLGEMSFSRPLLFFVTEKKAFFKIYKEDRDSSEIIRELRARGIAVDTSDTFYFVNFDQAGIDLQDFSGETRLASIPGVKGDFFQSVDAHVLRWRIRFPSESLAGVNEVILSKENFNSAYPMSVEYMGGPRSTAEYLKSCNLGIELSTVSLVRKITDKYAAENPEYRRPFHAEWKFMTVIGKPGTEVRFSSEPPVPSQNEKVIHTIRNGPMYITEEEILSRIPQYFAGEQLINGTIPIFLSVESDGKELRQRWVVEKPYVNDLIAVVNRINNDGDPEVHYSLEEATDFVL